MKVEEVKALLETSQTAQEWNDNCTRIKINCGGAFWWKEIIESGFAQRVMNKWNGFAGITLEKF